MSNGHSPAIKNLNITGLNLGKFASLLGEAHEYLVAGILIRMGFVVSVHTSRGGSYDLIIEGYQDFDKRKKRVKLLRAQVKTTNGIKLGGGARGGIDREYIPGVKTYKYTEEHSDLIIGVDRDTLDLYIIPTRFVSRWGESVSKKKVQPLKNNTDILLNWNDSFLKKLESRL